MSLQTGETDKGEYAPSNPSFGLTTSKAFDTSLQE